MTCKSSHCECNETARKACDVRLAQSAKKFGAPVVKRSDYSDACRVNPSQRNRAEWEAIRDKHASTIKCYVAQGVSVAGVAKLHDAAVQALAAIPVAVDPFELERLKRRDSLLTQIEHEARLCVREPNVDVAERFLTWLQQTNILRGRRF